jgi:plastocyanin domain-containing protein
VAVPEPLTLPGVTEPQESPEGIVSEIVIVPEKPFSAERVIVEVPDEPVDTDAGEEAVTVKSRKLKVVVAE